MEILRVGTRPSGVGRVQREGGPPFEVRPGDVVWFEPGEKHWHGATASTAMEHVALHEELDGVSVEWFEPFRDEAYAESDAGE